MQVKQIWSNVDIVTPTGVLRNDVLIEGDRFVGFNEPGTDVSQDWQRIDGQGKIVFPGIIDLLQHGFDKYLYNDVLPGCVADNSRLMARYGVTGFLPSISCLPPDTLEPVLARLSRACDMATGARALGVHSEGPCFGTPGAHNPKNLQLPSVELAQAMLSAADGKLKAVTIAPELPGAQDFIKIMKRAGVSIHLGHSDAKAEDISRYASWGIDAVTHIFNALRGAAPDDTGVQVFSLPDALLAEPSLALGLICDGIHVHPKLVQMLSHLPADRVFLETDANKFAGGEKEKFEFYPGYWVTSERGNAVRDDRGLLCGSSLTPLEALRNFVKFSKKDLVRAAHATSLLPARVLGMEKDIGSIEIGKLADFAVLDKETLAVQSTYVAGKSVYECVA